MKVHQTVKTKELAEEIINEAFKSVADKYVFAIWKNESCKCDCGESPLLTYNALMMMAMQFIIQLGFVNLVVLMIHLHQQS